MCVVNIASYDNYMLINSYLTFCFLLFSMTTLLQLGVDKLELFFFQGLTNFCFAPRDIFDEGYQIGSRISTDIGI